MATVLIIDSDNTTRKICRAELQKEGYQVFAVRDCKQASDLSREHDFDLVVFEFNRQQSLDLNFLEERIKSDPHVKIVINSDYPDLKMNFHTWIADAFLAKSSGLSKLKKTIHALLNSREDLENRIN